MKKVFGRAAPGRSGCLLAGRDAPLSLGGGISHAIAMAHASAQQQPRPRQRHTRQVQCGLRRPLLLGGCLLALGLASGCQREPSAESQRLDRLDLKIQQLEQRLNKVSLTHDGADKAGKPPAGAIKSLTLRMGSEDDRLRIYWADGSRTDLPCTKEQSTFVCG